VRLSAGEEEYTRTYRLLEDGRRQDSKRINDLLAKSPPCASASTTSGQTGAGQ
jgi:hypothetical protein